MLDRDPQRMPKQAHVAALPRPPERGHEDQRGDRILSGRRQRTGRVHPRAPRARHIHPIEEDPSGPGRSATRRDPRRRDDAVGQPDRAQEAHDVGGVVRRGQDVPASFVVRQVVVASRIEPDPRQEPARILRTGHDPERERCCSRSSGGRASARSCTARPSGRGRPSRGRTRARPRRRRTRPPASAAGRPAARPGQWRT